LTPQKNSKDWLAGQLNQIFYKIRVHNLDLLKKEISNENPAKKAQAHKNQIFASTQCLEFMRNTT
jgi:hypothetical protein